MVSPSCKNSRTLELQKTKSEVVNKTWKVQQFNDNQSCNSCHIVVSHFCSAATVHFTWPLTSAKAWCPCSPDALLNISVFCTDLRLEVGRLVRGIVKNWIQNHQNCILIRPRSWWGLEQSVFFISISLWDGNVHHYITHLICLDPHPHSQLLKQW